MIIDRVVRVESTGFPVGLDLRFVAVACSTVDDKVPTAVGDPTEFFDVYVDYVHGCFVLVTADVPPAGPVLLCEFGHPETGDDFVHAGGVQARFVADSVRSPAVTHAQPEDLSLGVPRKASRRFVVPVGDILHACLAVFAAVGGPAQCSGDGDLETFRGATPNDHPRRTEPASAVLWVPGSRWNVTRRGPVE